MAAFPGQASRRAAGPALRPARPTPGPPGAPAAGPGGVPGAPPLSRPPSRWERARPIAVPVLVALAAKVATVALTFYVLGRPDDFWHRMAWQWDGEHYVGIIARDGYQFRFEGEGDSVHFAFLYPLLIRLLGGSEWAALALNNAASLAAVAIIAWHWGPRPALAFGLFPAWLVFGSVAYSEGLYVLLAALAIAGVERGRLLAGGLAAGLAACARYLGGPALLLAAVPWRAWREARRWLAFALVALTGVALFAWMWYWTGEFLGYYESQRSWGGAVAWPWEHFSWLLHGWFTHQGGDIAPWGNLSPIDFATRDVVFLAPVVAGLVLLWQDRAARLPSFVYSLAIVLVAVCTTGTPAAALPRYLAAAFPAIAILGDRVRPAWAWTTYVAVAVALATHGLSHHLYRYWS